MKSTCLYICLSALCLMMSACSSNPKSEQFQPVNIAVIAYPDRNYNVDYSRLVNAISDDLVSQGHNVYDQNIFALDDFNLKIGANYKPSVLDMAQAVEQPRLDYLLLLDVSPVIKSKAYSQLINTDINVSLQRVHSGNTVGGFEVIGQSLNSKPDCINRCLKNKLEQSSVITAGDIVTFANEYLSESIILPTKVRSKSGKTGISPKGTKGW